MNDDGSEPGQVVPGLVIDLNADLGEEVTDVPAAAAIASRVPTWSATCWESTSGATSTGRRPKPARSR